MHLHCHSPGWLDVCHGPFQTFLALGRGDGRKRKRRGHRKRSLIHQGQTGKGSGAHRHGSLKVGSGKKRQRRRVGTNDHRAFEKVWTGGALWIPRQAVHLHELVYHHGQTRHHQTGNSGPRLCASAPWRLCRDLQRNHHRQKLGCIITGSGCGFQ